MVVCVCVCVCVAEERLQYDKERGVWGGGGGGEAGERGAGMYALFLTLSRSHAIPLSQGLAEEGLDCTHSQNISPFLSLSQGLSEEGLECIHTHSLSLTHTGAGGRGFGNVPRS